MSKIKVAFIGAGYMASEHIRAFADINNVIISGIFSKTINKAEFLVAKFENAKVCNSIALLYEETKADIVVITVSELSTESICEEAFKFPWTCLIEKPVGYNLESALRIHDMLLNSKANVKVALNRRFYSSTRSVLDGLKYNTDNRIVKVVDQEDILAARIAGRPKLVIQNWMYANSIHLIDYFNILCRGEITSIENIIKWNPNSPGIVLAKINFSSGDIGIYEAYWNRPAPWSVVISTEKIRWSLEPLEQAKFQEYGTRTPQQIDVDENDIRFKCGLRNQAEQVINCVKGLSNNAVSFEEALKTMRLVNDLYT